MDRSVCYRCRKASVMCYCKSLKRFSSQPRFVILIHPKEARKAINTGRMAYLALDNATLIEGLDFTDHPALNAILDDAALRPYLLFPGKDAQDLATLAGTPPSGNDVFIILDATWAQAKKMFDLSANLRRIPQIMFTPPAISQFTIRKQPRPECYSTIETIHHIIEVRGGQPQGEHHHLLELFRTMVTKQIDYEVARWT